MSTSTPLPKPSMRVYRLASISAAIHFAMFLVSSVIAQQAEGWAGVFVWPVWAGIDLPWSLLCYLIVYQTPLNSLLRLIRAGTPLLDYLLYPPFIIHGVIGTVWWWFVPVVFSRWRARRAA